MLINLVETNNEHGSRQYDFHPHGGTEIAITQPIILLDICKVFDKVCDDGLHI